MFAVLMILNKIFFCAESGKNIDNGDKNAIIAAIIEKMYV
jgi:hypothetical protein